MMQHLSQMTNTELKRYLSDNRNNEESFRMALEVLMSRLDPATEQPFSLDAENVEALLKEKLGLAE